ncbi:hypothetical protein C5167_037013 [Papaver somniferum]|uniref:Uncharacterized protein n=1 Tax=Papaver somniferum TaxID=3469 RepID=A0A4Y7I581_PAPSO|nr:hypothetical protein C5167_037013 [Papaver somniferum]
MSSIPGEMCRESINLFARIWYAPLITSHFLILEGYDSVCELEDDAVNIEMEMISQFKYLDGLFFLEIPLYFCLQSFRIGAGYIFCDQGYQMNMQPSCAEAGFHIRIPPTVDPKLLVKRIFDE